MGGVASVCHYGTRAYADYKFYQVYPLLESDEAQVAALEIHNAAINHSVTGRYKGSAAFVARAVVEAVRKPPKG